MKRFTRTSLILVVLSILSLSATAWAAESENVRVQQIWTVSSLVQAVGSDLNTFWASQFLGTQWQYIPPAIFTGYTTTIMTGCGPVDPINAVYCGADHGIYYDENLLRNILNDVGDYAAAAIIAHEWAHLVQNLIGILGAGFPTVITELQADCLTGIYTYAADNSGLLDFGDIDEAARVFFAFGDDLPLLHPNAHGSPQMRQASFEAGLRFGFEGCSIEQVVARIENPNSTPTPQPPIAQPPTGGSSAYDYDIDGDCFIADFEFFSATDMWIGGQLSDIIFFDILDAWIGGFSVCPFSSSSQGDFEISQRSGEFVFSADTEDSRIDVQIYDSSGELIFSEQSSSRQLSWNLRNSQQQRMANGVYLYVVQQFGPDGSITSYRAGKIAVLN